MSTMSPPPFFYGSADPHAELEEKLDDQPPKFSAPAHPSVHLLEKLRADESSAHPDRPPPYVHRDPHEQPTFTPESLAHPVHPVLYLPPLISALPSSSTAVDPAHPAALQQDQYPGRASPPAVLTTATRLPEIDPVSLSLHRALHYFQPLSEKYAATPYGEAFNWGELRLPEDEEREWYCVAFRSRRKEGSDGDGLYEADKKAHEEAVENGGLLMYWYGVPDPHTGLNLATCIWQSRAHAAAANARPHHIRAMRLARDAYAVYALERHVLRKEKGSTRVQVVAYEGGEVGW
ncbi:hypothetical protein DFH11DRAFT_449690 [Phellopilus nigrolimitatus]|nr:hypothetical protein DFH11DRAFT_449690 [Phellopilus nigrolimitatus]